MTSATFSRARLRKGGNVAKETVYVANWLISGHKGQDFQPGSEVRLPEDEAAPFLACGALSVKGNEAEKTEEPAGE